jgi:GGDEF domain-containing protein
MANNNDKINETDKLYGNPLSFKVRAQEELRRAKRYATFVSLVSVDLAHVDSSDEIQNFSGFDEFMKSLRKLIRNSIRETDIVSNFDRQKVSILLLDTPREGASAMTDRLRKILRYFMCDNIRSPLNWRVPIKEYYFPSSSGEDFSIQAFLDHIAAD